MEEGKQFDSFKVLSHPLRVRIIELLSENVELSYMEILNTLQIDTGQLNFHLKNLADMLERTEEGNYILTHRGKAAYKIASAARRLMGSGSEAKPEPGASLFKRSAAAAIDFFLFVGSPFIVVMILGLWLPHNPEELSPIEVTQFLHSLFFLTLIAFMTMEAYNGQTIGKLLFGIRVVKENGRKLNLVEATVRNVAKIFFLPLDLAAGLLFYGSKGYVKFADYYLKTRVVDMSASVEEENNNLK